MFPEPASDRARRATVHAALADPARLQITDTLLAGDASPSELAAMLAMPSNLLAHHLHVLEQAGVITRRRSEGDRRRTYLRLVPGTLDSLAAPPPRAARRGLVLRPPHSAPSPPRPPPLGPPRHRRPRRGPPRAGAQGTGPATSGKSGARMPAGSRSATWPGRTSAGRPPCTGPSRPRSRPAIPPASTRP